MTLDIDKGISELVGVFTDPIIVYRSGAWGDTIPDWVRQQITIERLAENMRAIKSKDGKGTDAEALAYLYTASLEFPLDHDWTNIYLYITRKEYEKANRGEFPSDITVDSLSDYEAGQLNELKDWIYRMRAKHRKELEKKERREARQRAEESKPRQLELIFEGIK